MQRDTEMAAHPTKAGKINARWMWIIDALDGQVNRLRHDYLVLKAESERTEGM